MRQRLSKRHIRPLLRHFNRSLLKKVLTEHPELSDEFPGFARASLDWGVRAVTEKFRNRKTLDAFLPHASVSSQVVVAHLLGQIIVAEK